MIRLVVSAALAAMLSFASPAAAQTPTLDSLAAKVKGQTITLAVHSTDGQPQTVDAFKRRFPDLKVELTLILPSAFVPRALTEQKNGMFAWDSFWGGTSNLVGALLPAGGIDRMDKYLLLPEVTEPSNWNAPDYLWATNEPYIFIHSNYAEAGIYTNADTVKGMSYATPEALLDPRLKGKITVRDPSRPNVATASLAGLIKVRNEDFVRKILTEQAPLVVDIPRQADDSLIRGDAAVLIGGSPDTFVTCKNQGACKSIGRMRVGQYVRSIGVIVLKNAPHPEPAALWINWLLSKEGQTAFVREYGKYNETGAISMRKDVPPLPAAAEHVPDYARMNEYLRTSVAEGEAAQNQVTKLWASIKNK